MIRTILLVGAGGFLGAVSRWLLSLVVQPRGTVFPVATLTVNIVGCLCIGLVFGLFDRGGLSHEWRVFLATGFLGGFTTFSAFSNETFMLLRDGHLAVALLYVAASVVAGLLATWLGWQLVK
jgi:CrcB protein